MRFWSIFSLLLYIAIFFSWYLYEKLVDYLMRSKHERTRKKAQKNSPSSGTRL